MLFYEYSHMENDYKLLKCINTTDILYDKSLKFVALEKIHGTNFSFVTDGKEVHSCKRSSILKSEENIYTIKITQENTYEIYYYNDILD